MSIKVGEKFFDGLLVISKDMQEVIKEVDKWRYYYLMCAHAKNEKDEFLRLVFDACNNDEFDELDHGTAKAIYNEAYKRTA